MAFGITPPESLRINTYTQAKQLHDGITPIRNKPDIRPIFQRRAQHMRVEEGVDLGHKSIRFVLYKTPVVTYLDDGRVILNTGGHITQSTRTFIDHVCGVARTHAMTARSIVVTARRAVLDTLAEGCSPYGQVQYGQYRLDNTLTLGADRIPMDAKPFVVHKVSMEGRAQVLNQFKRLISYVKTMNKVLPTTGEELRIGNMHVNRAQFEAALLSTDEEQWLPVLEYCRFYAARNMWDAQRSRFYRNVDGAAVQRLLLSNLKHMFKDVWFTRVELNLGTFAVDREAKFFNK